MDNVKTDQLGLIVLSNIEEVGKKTNEYLKKFYHENKDYMIPISNSRFSNGEGKVRLEDSVRDKDLYILSDVGNYSMTYMMHGNVHHISPDEHFQDIKRVIAATSGHASRVTVVMPLLYQSRQHKRSGMESLDCAIALQELEAMGVDRIITFDCHDPNVSNAIPRLPFENFYPTHTILKKLIQEESDHLNDLLVVSPDMGAMERARYYAEMIGCDVGVFYKRRDLSRVVNGKNPIVEHVYMGADVKGKDILVVDDMIASGTSMIEVGKKLKENGANHVYFVATFALFTEGTKVFSDAYQEGIFDKLYVTNLSYVPESIKVESWYQDVDCSYQLSQIIHTCYERNSLVPLWNGKKEIIDEIHRMKACVKN